MLDKNKNPTVSKMEIVQNGFTQDELDEVVCMYCYQPKNEKIGCCGENHFTPLKELL